MCTCSQGSNFKLHKSLEVLGLKCISKSCQQWRIWVETLTSDTWGFICPFSSEEKWDRILPGGAGNACQWNGAPDILWFSLSKTDSSLLSVTQSCHFLTGKWPTFRPLARISSIKYLFLYQLYKESPNVTRKIWRGQQFPWTFKLWENPGLGPDSGIEAESGKK